MSHSPFKRQFPPLYQGTGNSATDRLAFFHVLERLKTQKRTGWVNNNIPDAESISDHMYRMAVLAMCTSDTSLDIPKYVLPAHPIRNSANFLNGCVMMCVVHDLAEAHVGDIAPREGIPKETKQRLEAEAMHNFVHVMLHNSPAAQRIEALWHEYEEGKTPEAKFVKDLDRFEMASQALEYEKRHKAVLQPFFDSSIPKINHPEVKSWGSDLLAERSLHQSQPTDTTNADSLLQNDK